MDTELEYQTEGSGQQASAAQPAPPGPPAADTAAAAGASSGSALFEQYQCAVCHTIESETDGVGPSLHDVGGRLNRAEIYESIVEPDAVIAEGYQPKLMGTTLEGAGFYNQVTAAELKTLVDYLASQTGE